MMEHCFNILMLSARDDGEEGLPLTKKDKSPIKLKAFINKGIRVNVNLKVLTKKPPEGGLNHLYWFMVIGKLRMVLTCQPFSVLCIFHNAKNKVTATPQISLLLILWFQ